MSGERHGLKLVKRPSSPNWYIHGTAYGKEVRRSTKTSDREAAEVALGEEVSRLKQEYLYGSKPRRKWEEAVVKYLEYVSEPNRDLLWHLRLVERYLKGKFLDEIDDDVLRPFIKSRKKSGVKSRTINLSLQVVRRILNLAARKWRWISVSPLLDFVPQVDKRKPYPLTWEEQDLLFSKMPKHLVRMCLFKVNTGTRDREVCWLLWEWLVKRDDGIWYFEIPQEQVKNRLPRIVILNRIAKSIVRECMGNGSPYVFVFNKKPLYRMGKKAFAKAREKAGLPKVRVHDLKHTFGARLRAAGVPEEDRKFLLGHKSGMSMTTHYSAPELQRMLEFSNRVCKRDNSLVLLNRNQGNAVREKSVARTKSAQKKFKGLRLLATP